MINGIHHVCLKCYENEYDRVLFLYKELLGLKTIRTMSNGCMLDANNMIIEIFANKDYEAKKGCFPHLAFNVYDVDGIIDLCRKNGFEVFVEPKDIVLGDDNLNARIAFIKGGAGEDIEFFCEK